MATIEMTRLASLLMESRFHFLSGTKHIRDVYRAVKRRYPELCDDHFLSPPNHTYGVARYPEWKHTVRTTLKHLKEQGHVSSGNKRGLWVFSGLTAQAEAEAEAQAIEGKRRLKRHLVKERDPDLVHRKKQAVLDATGHLACQVCRFDFAQVYGKIGRGFAECHHLVPVAELDGKSVTRLEDLAIVCSNCHRMLHRSDPMLKVEDLRLLVRRRQAK
jgi:hypothetical protein